MRYAEKRQLPAGLHFVATPIGSARDITLNALDVLASADVLASEDTRTTRRLMDIHGIPLEGRPLIAYHDHNGPRRRPQILAHLEAGKSVAYVSEAGTPLVADPGYALGRAAIEAGHRVFAVPGPSALLAALTVSGMPTDRFLFAGFPPTGRAARRRFLRELADIPATVVFYESPKRIHGLLDDLVEVFGSERDSAIGRELTKRFEEVMRGPIADLREQLAERRLKGEIVLVVGRPVRAQVSRADLDRALEEALETHTRKDAVALVAERLGLARREVYQAALALGKDGAGSDGADTGGKEEAENG